MKMLKLVSAAVSDLMVRKFGTGVQGNGVAFLVHPRNNTDIIRKYPFLKLLGNKQIDWIMRHFWPVTVAPIYGVTDTETGEEVQGWVLASPLTAEQMLHNRELARKSIIETARLAQKKGARVVGLGAYTASLSRGGTDVRKALDIEVTTGRVFTTKTVTDIAEDALHALDRKNKTTKISVVGAAGSIGSGSTQILAKKGYQHFLLIDIERKQDELTELKQKLEQLYPDIDVTIGHSIATIKETDLVIAATNHCDALIKDEYLRPGMVVVDDAQPCDVEESALSRDDILVLEGGVVHTDEIRIPFNFGLQNRGDIFSCLAEAIILASDQELSIDTVGKMKQLDFEALEKFTFQAKRLGLRRGQFQNSERAYTDDDIERVKKIANS